MPDIATSPDASLPFVIDGCLYALQYLLCGCYLIGAHHQQLLIHVEYTILCQDIQDGMLGKEGRGKVPKVCQQRILLIAPIGCKLKGIALRLMFTRTTASFCLFGKARGVRVIFGLCTV